MTGAESKAVCVLSGWGIHRVRGQSLCIVAGMVRLLGEVKYSLYLKPLKVSSWGVT